MKTLLLSVVLGVIATQATVAGQPVASYSRTVGEKVQACCRRWPRARIRRSVGSEPMVPPR